MAEFTWTENSRTMFDESLKAAPLPFRAVTKRGLLKGLTSIVGEGGDVREVDVVAAIKAATPAPFVATGLKAVEPFVSDPSILTT